MDLTLPVKIPVLDLPILKFSEFSPLAIGRPVVSRPSHLGLMSIEGRSNPTVIFDVVYVLEWLSQPIYRYAMKLPSLKRGFWLSSDFGFEQRKGAHSIPDFFWRATRARNNQIEPSWGMDDLP